MNATSGGRAVLDHDPYGLSDRPFQLTPDPRFYFESATHRKAMTYLGYGLAQREGFIVVTGEVGTGKTTLVGWLMATIDRARLTAINLVSTQLEGEDILRIVALALGVATDAATKGQLLARIERFLHEQARGGRRTLLIVDEAQNLPLSAVEELRMLSNFQLRGQALLQIFLLGQPEFRDALGQPRFEQLRQRVIATHHLTALNPGEAAPYVMHRLSCAGWTGTPRFTQDAYDAFHRQSGGIPRRLNMLAGRVMLQGAIERLTDIDGEVVEDVAADLASESIMPAEGPMPMAQRFRELPLVPVEPVAAPAPHAMPAAPPVAAVSVPPSYGSWAPIEDEPLRAIQSGQNPFAALPDNVPPARPQLRAVESFSPPEPALQPQMPPQRQADVQPSRYPSFASRPQTPAYPDVAPPPAYQPADYQQYPPASAPAAADVHSAPPEAIDNAARNAQFESRLAKQEALLHRTLSLLVELVEMGPRTPQGAAGQR